METPVTHQCDVLVAGGGVAMTDDFTTMDIGGLQKRLSERGAKLFYEQL